MATDREEQQRRELEEIRRSFAEMGARMGPLFEPAQPDSNGHTDRQEEASPAAEPAPKPQRPPWLLAAVVAVVFLLGTGLGFVLAQGGGDDATPRAAAATSPPATRTRSSTPSVTQPAPRIVVPRVCLETAVQGDITIDLLTRKIRDQRLADALKAYTTASQACRKEASP